MFQILSFIKQKQNLIILFIILFIGFFLRTYKAIDRFEFAHDADLYSWIVKDILVNQHIRLVGQLTSAPGIFIGGLFYYMLIPFFLITKMDPIGGIYLTTILGLITTLSYYFVFSRLFNIKIGLIMTFLYAVLLSPVNFDRWLVPTITTNLWAVWYFYTLIKLTRGQFKALPIIGILIGLIWHIHIALIPALIAIPISILLSKKIPSKKDLLYFVITLFITSLPLILFEVKHDFQQIRAIITNFITPRDGITGISKFILVLKMISKNINTLLFAPLSFNTTKNIGFLIIFFVPTYLLVKKNIFMAKELFVLASWIISVVLFFSITYSPISEYYFSNLEIIFICLFGLYLYVLFNTGKIGKLLIIGILAIILIKNLNFIINQDFYHKGYLEKKRIVEFIQKDSKAKDYPCVGISYITAMGENVGFRYLFYLSNLHLVHPSNDVPVYNIVIPDELSKGEVKIKFGHIGLIPPTNITSKDNIKIACQSANTNLTDSMLGYVE